ncbi:hypothetical protein JHK86_009639 [Glycine max]|nr:hypothetical protein JHK86_009639 [Glycine max]
MLCMTQHLRGLAFQLIPFSGCSRQIQQRNQLKKGLKIRIESLKLLESGGAAELNNFRILNKDMERLMLEGVVSSFQGQDLNQTGYLNQFPNMENEDILATQPSEAIQRVLNTNPTRTATHNVLSAPQNQSGSKLQKVSSKRGKAATNPTSQREQSTPDSVVNFKAFILSTLPMTRNLRGRDGNPLKPMVHVDDSVVQGICTPWQDALVFKHFGKNIGLLCYKCEVKLHIT